MADTDSLAPKVAEFIKLVEAAQTVEAIERFYAPDVIVFENRKQERAGRDACIAYEKEQLADVAGKPTIKVVASAINEATGQVFLEYSIRFVSVSGREMLLEEVASQRWEGGLIVQERFYYQGFVDESGPL